VRRVTHEGMCSLTCETTGRRMGTAGLPGVPARSNVWDRQQDSARMDTVELFDGAGDGGRTRVPGAVWRERYNSGT
jgi:hypothetical protein